MRMLFIVESPDDNIFLPFLNIKMRIHRDSRFRLVKETCIAEHLSPLSKCASVAHGSELYKEPGHLEELDMC